MEPLRIRDIKGLTPAIDPTRSDEIFVLSGKNYVFGVKGPRSAFGNRILIQHPVTGFQYVQGFRIKIRTGTRVFVFLADGIVEWDESIGGWVHVFITTDTSLTPYRWTWGYLNGKLFFCHPQVNILVYDVDSAHCEPHKAAGVPQNALAIEINNGLLTVIDPEWFTWSAPSDGMNFSPEFGGAGAQRISDRVSGYPILVTSYTRGCLIWTTGGVMRSEFSGDVAVYRHRALQTEYRPINSFCTCRIDDDTVVILDERGLFQSRGDALTPFAPMFNEFISDYIQRNNLNVGNNVRIEWDELQRRMYISVSLSYSDSIYEHCFVLYPNLDKWGQFNEPHYGILPLKITTGERADDYYGFVDSDKLVRYWVETGSREVRAKDCSNKRLADLKYPLIQKPVQYLPADGGRVLSSSGLANTIPAAAAFAGYYLGNASSVVIPTRQGLDSVVRFGLIRANPQSASDELFEITSVTIRNLLQDNAVTDTGYNITPATPEVPNADLNQGKQSTDLSFDEHMNYVNHKMRIVGTVDARTEFSSVEPTLVRFTRDLRYYACSVVGLWHIIEMSATEVGEAIHPVTFELTAVRAGKIV